MASATNLMSNVQCCSILSLKLTQTPPPPPPLMRMWILSTTCGARRSRRGPGLEGKLLTAGIKSTSFRSSHHSNNANIGQWHNSCAKLQAQCNGQNQDILVWQRPLLLSDRKLWSVFYFTASFRYPESALVIYQVAWCLIQTFEHKKNKIKARLNDQPKKRTEVYFCCSLLKPINVFARVSSSFLSWL